MFRKFKIGLALGGGAARGFAHIGVLEALRDNFIPIGVITGTSMGAIIGGLYATNPDIDAVKEKIYSYIKSDVFKKAGFDFLKEKDLAEGEGIFYRFSQFVQKSIFYTLSVTKKAFISKETVNRNLALLLDDINIEDTLIPFAVTSLDLNSGEEFVIKSGPLRKAVAASCAIPGILPPVEYGEKLLVDGGWIDAVPIAPALQLGADVEIGVDIGRGLGEYEKTANALDIVFRSDTISRYALSNEKIKSADLILKPNVSKIHWADFGRIDECILEGRNATDRSIGDIRRVIRKKRILGFFRGKW